MAGLKWIADPTGRHEYRLTDDQGLTDTVSDAGVMASDPLSPPPGAVPRRRRRIWIWAGALAASVVVVGLAGILGLIGLGSILDSMEIYEPDMTSGSGDFPTTSDAEQVREYTPSGYRMESLVPEQQIESGVVADSAHSALSVTITVRNEHSAVTSSIGPLCLGSSSPDPDTRTGWVGYHMALGSDGVAWLGRYEGGAFTALDSEPAAAFGDGDTATLSLVCSQQDGVNTLVGYVNGTKVVRATETRSDPKYSATGMMATAHDPSAWLITAFARRGPDDFPADWNTAE